MGGGQRPQPAGPSQGGFGGPGPNATGAGNIGGGGGPGMFGRMPTAGNIPQMTPQAPPGPAPMGGTPGAGPNVKGGGIAPAGGVQFGNVPSMVKAGGINPGGSATPMSQFNPQMAQQGGYMGGQSPNAPIPVDRPPSFGGWSPQRFGGPEGMFPGAGQIRGGMTGPVQGGAMQGGGGGKGSG